MLYKLILCLVLFLGATFFVANLALAVDDNSISSCATSVTGYSCDTNQPACEGIVGAGHWVSNGYPEGTGNPNCCEDDSQENLLTPLATNISWSPGLESICWSSSGCVKDGVYYGSGTHSNLNPSGNDNISYCAAPTWRDCDVCKSGGWTSTQNGVLVGCESICTNFDNILSGEDHAFGEYSNNTTPGACGDDSDEYEIDTFCQWEFWTSSVCCDNPGDKINADGKCVESCSEITPRCLVDSTCDDMSDINSDPATLVMTTYFCSFSAESCVYKFYKNTTNNFGSANVIATRTLTRNADGKYTGDDGQGDFISFLVDQDVTPNTQYYYWVAEYDSNDNPIAVSDVSSGYSGRLGKVTGLHSHQYSGNGQLAILWQWDNYPTATDYNFGGSSNFRDEIQGLDSYYIYETSSLPPHSSDDIWRINNSGFEGVFDLNRPFYLFSADNQVLSDIQPGQRVKLLVRPNFDTQGTIACGPDSAEDIVLIGDTCDDAPTAPTNLAHSNTANSLTWTWTAPTAGCSPVVSYKVYGRKYDAADFVLLDTVAGTSFTWSGLLANTKYEVKVAAVDSEGRLGAFVGPAGFYTSIEQPTLNCSNETISSIRLETVGTLTAPAPASVTYDLKNNFAKADVYYGWQTASQKDATGLNPATTYTFSIKTRNGDGDENTPTTKTCSTLSNLSVDLIIDSISAPDYVCQGSTMNADIVTKNIGNTSSGQTSKTKVYIDSDDSGAGGIANLMDTWINSLNPGIEQTKTTDAWNTTGVSIGNHQIVAIADAPADSRISESNEGNNVLRKTIEVRACTPTTGGDFDLVTPGANASGVSLSPTAFSWSALSDAISYNLYLCPSVDSNWANCSSPVQIINLATTSYSTTTLAVGTSYLWQVTATTPTVTKAAKNGPRRFTTASTALAGIGPTADFTFCKYSADTLQFNDTSSAGDSRISSWSWNFGDSETCTAAGNCTESGYPGTNQYPVHTFSSSDPQINLTSGLYWSGNLDAPPIPSGGSLGGTPSYVPGKIGNGLEFNSSSEWLEVVMTESMKDRGFITFWYKPYYDSSNNSTNYLMEAYYNESLLQLVHTNTGGLYFKVEAPGRSSTLTLANITNYTWTANQWVLLGVGWDLPSRKITISVNGVDSNLTTGSYNNSLEFTEDDKLRFGSAIGSSGQGAFTSNGVFDDVKIYTTYTHTSTPGGGTSFNVNLTVADAEGDSDSEQKVVDVSTAQSCVYNLTNVAPNNCNSIGLEWSRPVGYTYTPDYYYIYRSGDAGSTWNLLQTQSGASIIFDDNTVKENSTYEYYLSTSPAEIAYNNSTLNPVCSGGFGTSGAKCSLSATTPVCGISGSSTVTLSHSCGKITASWPKDANAKLYQLQRSYGSDGPDNKYVNIATIYSTDTIRCPSSSTDCSYIDNEIVPVNVVNPPAAKKYWYRLREQRNDNSWSNWSTGVEDYSYCYRAPNWQEE